MARSSGLKTPQHAITDLYDTQRGAFLVRYPLWLVLGLAIAGVIAFGMAGFLGYPGDPGFFLKPWELYLWFSALVITLLASIFRNRALRGYLIATLIVAALCIILVYLFSDPTGFLRHLLQQYLPLLAKEQLTYVIVNFAAILIFWVDTIRRWVRRSRGLRPHPVLDLITGEKSHTADPAELPSMAELVSGDLIAGSVLTGLLSYIFRPDVMSFVTQTNLSNCTLSVTFPPSGCVGVLPSGISLILIDQTQSLSYLAVGLLILGLAAMLGGFGSVGGAPMPIGVSQAVYEVLNDGNPPVTAIVTTGVAETVLDTLRAAISRRLREFFFGLGHSLRNVAWPVLLFTTTFGVYQLSLDVQMYLHTDNKTIAIAAHYILPAALWGLASVFSIVFSAALVVFKWRVVDNTLRFLGLIGVIVLLTFWIFSLALWGFNKLLEQFSSSVHTPFDPPSIATAISFGALIILGGVLLFSRRGIGPLGRRPAASQPVAARVAAGSNTPAPSSLPEPTTAPLPKNTQE